MDRIRWGIVGTGKVARAFAGDLPRVPGAELAAVASRSPEKAQAFAREFGARRAHSRYEDLAADPEVDALYIATPHARHRGDAMLGLEAGKAVLCEKAFTTNAREAEELIAAARRRGVFLMEAMWTRFFPAVDQLRAWLREGAIGEPRVVHADLCYAATYDPSSRLFDPALGGGALLDLGIYGLSFASLVFGGAAPSAVRSSARLFPHGCDEFCSMLLDYEGGRNAVICAGFNAHGRREAGIYGPLGRIVVREPFWRPVRLSLEVQGREPEPREFPFEGRGYRFEIAEVVRCLREGRTESDRMPLDETLSLMKLMDGLRREWGVRYPADAEPC